MLKEHYVSQANYDEKKDKDKTMISNEAYVVAELLEELIAQIKRGNLFK
jgi:hypothetical protein